MNALDEFDVVSFKPRHLNALRSLLELSFGGVANLRGAFGKDVLKYYRLVFDESELVAASGIVPPEHSVFNGYEVIWTCTLPKYRRGGICTELLRRCIMELPNDGISVFCDCWRFPGRRINLFHPMTENRFELVVPEASVFSTKFSKLCLTCPHRSDGDFECRCYTDIWKRSR